jgi:cell division protein FtsB
MADDMNDKDFEHASGGFPVAAGIGSLVDAFYFNKTVVDGKNIKICSKANALDIEALNKQTEYKQQEINDLKKHRKNLESEVANKKPKV